MFLKHFSRGGGQIYNNLNCAAAFLYSSCDGSGADTNLQFEKARVCDAATIKAIPVDSEAKKSSN